ncbi:phosphatase PAP2 family protein [Leptospira ilyithenensis]|uniref:Phosphatase PAP2 family protein n=2 Tax=Leptospira ilyithenensis TaxID=2484901 RepID=A0A4R9LMQ6_9LEPT|nr:phosphatase PAP2 family protein [Leptospira ilyithenensis]
MENPMNDSFFSNQAIWFSQGPLDSLHSLDPSLGTIFHFLSLVCHFLGGTVFFLGLISTAFVFFSPKRSLELSFALLTSGIVIGLAKFYFESPRPHPYPEAFDEKAFGFPSGHAYCAVVVWGLLVYRIKNLGFRIFALTVIILTPFSRMYLRVHFLGDVTLGFLMGLIHLFLIILVLRSLDKKSLPHYFFKTEKYRTLGLLGIVITLSLLLLDSRYSSSEHYHSLAGAVTASGALAGFWMGLLFYPRFSKEENLDWGFPKKEGKPDYQSIFVRLAVLFLFLIVFYILPSLAIKNTIWKDDLFLKYLRYFLVSFALVLGFPVLLQKISRGRFLFSK